MPDLRSAILLLVATVAAVVLTGVPVFAEDTPEVPVAPQFTLPSPAAGAIVVANDTDRYDNLKRRGYRVYSDISQAIARADDGDSIYVTAGTYREDLYIEERQSLSLIGEEGVLVVADNDQDVCFMIECSNVLIHNIDMVHEIGESPCLHNCIVVWDCRDVLIEYCDLSGCGYFGVEVLGNGDPGDIRVENCAIHDCEEAYYDVLGDAIIKSGNVLWDNAVENWDPTGWEEGEMFGSERQPHAYNDYSDWVVSPEAPQPPAIELPPPGTAGLLVVAGDELTEDHYSEQGYDTYFTIQSAIDAAQNGDTVYVTSGIYFESIELTDLDDLTLIGEELVLVVADLFSDVCSINGCDNLRIYNIDVVHEEGEDCSQNCFVILDSQDVTLEYCDISGCGFIGIWVWGFDADCSVRAERCYIHDCEAAYSVESGASLKLFGTVIRDCEQQTW